MSNLKKAKPTTGDKDKKPKLVRDSFTIPKSEYAALDTLKARALAAGVAIKKSELLRAGLMALSGMGDAAFKGALASVPTLKTGRPTQQPAKAPAPVKTAAPAPKPTIKAAAPAPAAAKKPTAVSKPSTTAKKTAAAPAAKKAPAPAAAKPAAGKSAAKRGVKASA